MKLIREQPRGFNLLRLPLVKQFVRWKYSRFILQLPLLILALFVIIDGFSGRQIAPRNVATVSVWLHYRGLVVIALAIFGNAFCAACPLMLTRGLSRQLSKILGKKRVWPKYLRNKYFVTIFLLFYFFAYEYFDLWASPWLTAWLAVGYFSAALVIDTLFPAGTFCKNLCPLGNWNSIYSSASPTQIRAVDHDVCRNCSEKPCLQGRYSAETQPPVLPMQTNGHKQVAFIPQKQIIAANGQGFFPGCESDLFVPAMQSNVDCTYCFNCVRACPYDNVALTTRVPGWEWLKNPWEKHGRLSLMIMGVLLTIYGLMNAIAMIPPYYVFAQYTANLLHTNSELLVLGLFFLGFAVIGLSIAFFFATVADFVGGKGIQPRKAFMRWGYTTVALGFGFWFAHYMFHFLTGALSIVPIFEHFFSYRGFNVDPNWRMSQFVPSKWLFPITASINTAYALLASYYTIRIGVRDFKGKNILALWPMLFYILLFAVFGVWILAQPMEMRGTIFQPSY